MSLTVNPRIALEISFPDIGYEVELVSTVLMFPVPDFYPSQEKSLQG